MLLRAAGTTDVWAGLRAGADDVLSPIDQQRAPDTDATLTNLVFTGRVAREAMRLHPPGLVGARAAAVDVASATTSIDAAR